MTSTWRFFLNRMRERLWVRPLFFCMASIGLALLARLADSAGSNWLVITVTSESVVTLLRIMAASMLVIATLAVTSMVSAYASASSTATPRTFALIVADDVSQNALSTFVGAFIFSIVALIAIQNGYYGYAGRFFLFALTLIVFAVVIVTFVTWVDSIARLGRLGATVKKVEMATDEALQRRRAAPTMGGVVPGTLSGAIAVYADTIGYVQRVDVAALQACAEDTDTRIVVAALPGTFASPGRPIAHVTSGLGLASEADVTRIRAAFVIATNRTFEEDPRFGLIVLSEIACRALSPAVNDPGTAIDVLGSLVRLFANWRAPLSRERDSSGATEFVRVGVPELSLDDMFDDAFRGIARDGAGTIEVMVRLMKALEALAQVGDATLRTTAIHHAVLAMDRASATLTAPEDLALLRSAAQFASAEQDAEFAADRKV